MTDPDVQPSSDSSLEFLSSAAPAGAARCSAASAAAPASAAPMIERELVDAGPFGPLGTPGPLGPPGYTPPAILGYRQLSQTEVALINEGKAIAQLAGAQIETLRRYNDDLVDKLALAVAEEHLRTGFMWLSRSVAKPTTFG